MTARKDSPEAESSSVQRPSSSSTESPGFVQPPSSAHASGALLPFDLVGVQADLDRARLEIELGHTAAAELALSQIVAMLPRQDTSDAEVALVRASALAALGETGGESSDDASATRYFRESVALFEKLHERLDARRECDYGIALRHVGRPQEAILALRRALAGGETSSAARLHLGLALAEVGKEDDAETELRAAAEAYPHDRRVLFALAEILERHGSDDAVQAYRAAVYLAAEAGRIDEALALSERAVELAPNDWVSLATKGEVLRQLGRYEDALAIFEQARELAEADDLRLLGSIASTLNALGRHEEAIDALDRALALAPDYTFALTLRGQILRAIGRSEEAVEDELREYERELDVLREVLEEAPDNVVALASQGEALRQLGRDAEAIASFEAVLAKDPDATWILGELGEALRREGRYEEALTQLERSARASGETGWNLGTKGQVLSALGRTDEAVEALRRAVELDPTLGWAYNELGDIFVERAEYERALTSFESALAIGTETYALASKGQALRLLGRYDEAIDALSHAVELDPKIAWVQAELGESLRMADRYVEALAALDSAIELEPDDVWARASHAATLFGLERYDEAIQELDKVIEDDSSYAFAVGKRGEIRNELAGWKEAIVDLTRSIELEDSEWFRGQLGWAFENDDQPDAALAAYDAALALEPGSAFSRMGRADALRALGSPDASREYERVLEEWEAASAEPRAGVLSVIGWCHYRLGRHDEALRNYTDYLALDPSSVSTQFDLALALAASGRGTLAASEFERGLELAKTKPPRRRRALLVIALRDLEDAHRTAIDDDSRKVLAEARDALSAALREEPTDAAAAGPK